MNWFAGHKVRHRCREETYGYQAGKAAGVWGGGSGVMNWEIGIDMYTLMCIKLMTYKDLLYKKIKKRKEKEIKLKKKSVRHARKICSIMKSNINHKK